MTRRTSSLVVVAIAILVVMGHVCAGPLHTHAGAAAQHSEDHPHPHDDEAAHGGSCEALKTTPSVDLPALPVVRLEGVVFTVVPTIAASLLPAPDTSPALFLLHAVLLI
jgi:hypothetical protein